MPPNKITVVDTSGGESQRKLSNEQRHDNTMASTVASSFDAATQKLSQGTPAFPLSDLPQSRDDSLWGEIRNEYGLTLPELSCLKNYAETAPQQQQQQQRVAPEHGAKPQEKQQQQQNIMEAALLGQPEQQQDNRFVATERLSEALSKLNSNTVTQESHQRKLHQQPQRRLNDVLDQDVDSLAVRFEEMAVLKTTESEESATPLPFVNRETECEQLATVLLANYKNRKRNRGTTTGSQSQHRLTLATSAQMFGSGKSTFGENFLPRLNSQDVLQQKLESGHGRAALEWLLGLKYVGIDFRHLNMAKPFIESIRLSLFDALRDKVPKEHQASVKQKLGNWKVSDMTCANIVQIFQEGTGDHFFLHLDEVSVLKPFLGQDQAEVMLLYQMWGEISGIHNRTESEVFCSGRSPSLFLLGKGYLRSNESLQSPEDAECILLDPLKKANVEEIFEVFLEDFDQEFIKRVHHLTGGVPRFVAHAVDFFTERIEVTDADSINYKERRTAFLQDSGPFVQYLEVKASSELNPLRGMSREHRDLFVELIRVAALRLPLRLDTAIKGQFWGFEGDVMTLEVCSAFPLYLQRWDADYHFLVIPPVILEKVAEESTYPRLPFWSSLYNLCPIQAKAQSSGDLLETMVQHILRLRVSEELHFGPRPLGQCLPFLEGSIIGNDTFQYVDFKSFPKISTVPRPGKAVADLRKFFDNPSAAGFHDVHPDDLAKVVGLFENGIFYVPRPMSSSGHLLFKTDQMNAIVEMQFKNGKQEVNSAVMAKELQKSCCFVSEEQVVFVMVALTTDETKLPSGTNVIDVNGNTIAWRYGPGASFGETAVPPNLEVIVVLEPGLVSFLTKANVDILRKDGLDLNDMALATQSPSKRRH